MRLKSSLLAALVIANTIGPVLSKETSASTIATEQVTSQVGEMASKFDADAIEDRLRFEPYQLLEELFFRDDVVYLMRHGPTDWSKLDVKDVSPTDCTNQRIMTEEGRRKMSDLGSLLASNDVVPSRIEVSEWCRNDQTLESFLEGIGRVNSVIADEMPVTVNGDLNLLLSLQGAKTVSPLRDIISNWNGHPTRKGPLLLISHYTNIEELTQFGVFEGEILVIDPKRNNQVIGSVRLSSASPDVGHFADTLESPLLAEAQAIDMVSRYYKALNSGDLDELPALLDVNWRSNATSPDQGEITLDGWLEELAVFTDGLSDARFEVDDIHYADNVVTVIGTVRGKHTGTLFDYPATGRDVAFGSIAVHRVNQGRFVESWQMADRQALIEQISQP